MSAIADEVKSVAGIETGGTQKLSPEAIRALRASIHKLSAEDRAKAATILKQQSRGCRTNKWMDMVRPNLHPKQVLFLSLEHREVMYGGAAGGGKSDALLLAAMQYVDVPGYTSIIFRRTFKDLAGANSIMDRAKTWFTPLKEYGVRWSASDNTWYFPTGEGKSPGRIAFGYLQHDNDKRNYLGWELHFCAFDELVQHPEESYSYLFSRLRRLKGSNIPIRMRSACVPFGDVLTVNSGWKDIREVRVGEIVYSINKDGQLEEKPVDDFYKTSFSGGLVSIAKQNLKMTMTPDHRVVYQKFGREDVEIVPWNQHEGQSISIVRSPKSWTGGGGYSGQTLGMSVDDYLSFMGIYLAEGCINQTVQKGNYKVIVTQGKKRAHEKVKELLDRTPWNWNWSKNGDFQTCSKSLREYLIQFGKSHQKFVPREILETSSREQLELFFQWLSLGDGYFRGNGITYVTTSPRIMNDVVEIGVKLGYKTMSSMSKSKNPNHRDRYDVYLSSGCNTTKVDKGNKRNDVISVPFSGDVYCIKVRDNENFIIRQEGTVWVSGNTNPGGVYGEWVKNAFVTDGYLNAPTEVQFSRMWQNATPCVGCGGKGTGQFGACLYCDGTGVRVRHFVPARLQDNPSIDMGEYLQSLILLPHVERHRMESGDWRITEQGNLFRDGWIRTYTRSGTHFVLNRPDQSNLTIEIGSLLFFTTADTATKDKTTADFTCVCNWAFHSATGSLILLSVYMDKIDTPEIPAVIIKESAEWKSQFTIIESASCAIGVIQTLRGVAGKGIAVLDYCPANRGDKVARSATAQIKMKEGQFYFPAGRPYWLDAPRAQLVGFNAAVNDDFVDNVSMAAWWAHSQHQVTMSQQPTEVPRPGT